MDLNDVNETIQINLWVTNNKQKKKEALYTIFTRTTQMVIHV